MNKKRIHIIGGGTISHVSAHLALCAPAYGRTAQRIFMECNDQFYDKMDISLHLTKMADPINSKLETNEDIAALVDKLIENESTKIIFFNPAMVDFDGHNIEVVGRRFSDLPSGKYAPRLSTRDGKEHFIKLTSKEKIVKKIRKSRKDIFLVSFKTTCNATEQEQYLAGLNLLKETSSNLVLANDIGTRKNMIITPEEAAYHVTTDRYEAIENLVEMAKLRSHLMFTRSTVIAGEAISWNSEEVPANLRTVVDHCIKSNAYKVFRGSTVGHFATKLDDTTFLTSMRKTNFNDLHKNGLVKIKTDGPDSVIAYGSKPSVGGQSQRIIFKENPDMDCIVHFHCPRREGSSVPVVSQREYECGSHECGQNTANGLKRFGNLLAVHLDNHGPNIIFSKTVDPQEVIKFIEANWDLAAKTGGYMV